MNYKLVTAVPVIVPAAYASGDAIGGLLTFADVCSPFEPSFRIVSAVITDLAKQSAVLRLELFDRTFVVTADNSPFDPSDTDILNWIGNIPWAAADYDAMNDSSAAHSGAVRICPQAFRLVDGGTSLFGQLVSYGTPTYVSAADVTIRLLIER